MDCEVRVIDKIIDALDIESLGFKIGNNDVSERPMFSPKDMLKLFVYGYFNGIRSSHKLAKQAVINKEIIWLINGIQPKYRVSKTNCVYSLFTSPGGFYERSEFATRGLCEALAELDYKTKEPTRLFYFDYYLL